MRECQCLQRCGVTPETWVGLVLNLGIKKPSDLVEPVGLGKPLVVARPRCVLVLVGGVWPWFHFPPPTLDGSSCIVAYSCFEVPLTGILLWSTELVTE